MQTYLTIWRIRLLLTSRVWDSARDVRVWEDAAGEIIGFAPLWRRRREDTYLVLDRFVCPATATDTLAGALLGWGLQQVRTIASERAAPMTLYAKSLDSVIFSDNHLISQGFTPVAPDPERYSIYFARLLPTALPTPALPKGYVIRPLQNSEEMAVYQSDLYEFAAVNMKHSQELLASDEYEHLVVVDPNGVFVAYCECSICRMEWQKSGQTIGWIDYVGTIPEQRQKGLGKTVLTAGLNQLRAWGAETVQLVTVNTNAPAIGLYWSMGLAPINVPKAASYEKPIAPD